MAIRDLGQIAQPGQAELNRTPQGIVPAELRPPVYWGTPHSNVRHSAGLSVFGCAMLAFIASFATRS